jgi:uncharacterized tellurite resistance protein B-like protein
MDEKLRSELVRDIQDFAESRWPEAVANGSAALTERHLQLAAAVLMVSVVRADRKSRQDEHRVLDQAVTRALNLSPEDAGVVVRAAEDAAERGESFAAALQRLDAGCTVEQKRSLVESLWRIAFADAELAGHEEYLVRKIAGKLGLSNADLIETKVRARDRFVREDL